MLDARVVGAVTTCNQVSSRPMAIATCTTLEDAPDRAASPFVCLMGEASRTKTQDARS